MLKLWLGVAALSCVLAIPVAETMCGSRTGEAALVQISTDNALQNFRQANLSYTCDECYSMIDSLQSLCKQQGGESRVVTPSYKQMCYEHAALVSVDYDNLKSKCMTFYDFVSELFCPLDPCVQITQSVNKAPQALCDMMRCTPTPKYKYIAPTVPLTCPEYMETIVNACAHRDEAEPPNSKACLVYPDNFQFEGCEMVLNATRAAANPLDYCAAVFCDRLVPTKFAEFCEKELHLSATNPIPVPAYLEWLEHADKNVECETPSGFGINVTSATYGRLCSDTVKNNILASVKARCDGKIKCVFGNQDMQNRSSKWDPLEKENMNTCSREFEIRYTCTQGGVVHQVLANDEAKFMDYPFDCVPDLKQYSLAVAHDERLAYRRVAEPRKVPAAF